jgi:hypothetical protein
MFSLTSQLLKPRPSIFSGTQKLISMNDRRIIRRPGNPVFKFPYHGAHTWNYKKYMCLDFKNADKVSTTAHFVITYNPTRDTNVTRATKRALLHFLPGCKVSLDPSPEIFRVVRMTDKRTIISTESPVDDDDPSSIDPLLSIATPSDLISDLRNMQRFIELARF